jgi:hypothetical protein
MCPTSQHASKTSQPTHEVRGYWGIARIAIVGFESTRYGNNAETNKIATKYATRNDGRSVHDPARFIIISWKSGLDLPTVLSCYLSHCFTEA